MTLREYNVVVCVCVCVRACVQREGEIISSRSRAQLELKTNVILAMDRRCILVKYLAVCDPLSVICR